MATCLVEQICATSNCTVPLADLVNVTATKPCVVWATATCVVLLERQLNGLSSVGFYPNSPNYLVANSSSIKFSAAGSVRCVGGTCTTKSHEINGFGDACVSTAYAQLTLTI
jgi:hypothetical protein